MKLFDLDGPFQHYGSIVFDLLSATILWLLISSLSLGLLAVPATIGLYAVCYNSILKREGYFLKTFFNAIKERFLFKFFYGLFYNLLFIITIGNIYLILSGYFNVIWLLPVYLFFLIELLLVGNLTLQLLANNSQLTFKQLLKFSFLVAHKHLPWSFAAMLLQLGLNFLVGIVLLGLVQYAILLFLVPGLIALAVSYLTGSKILERYDFFVNASIV